MRKQITQIRYILRSKPNVSISSSGANWLIFTSSEYLTSNGELSPVMQQIEAELLTDWELVVNELSIRQNSFRIQKTYNHLYNIK